MNDSQNPLNYFSESPKGGDSKYVLTSVGFLFPRSVKVSDLMLENQHWHTRSTLRSSDLELEQRNPFRGFASVNPNVSANAKVGNKVVVDTS
jgi:hypothetical protein